MNATYTVSTTQPVLDHFGGSLSLVRDMFEMDDAEMAARARVRSGDYFMTLATELDRIAQSLNLSIEPEAAELELIVAELLYVHKNYRIVGKA